MKPQTHLEWASGADDERPKIYSAKFVGPNKDFVLAAGTDPNKAKIIALSSGQVVQEFTDFSKACLVTDVSQDSSMGLIGCADGCIHVKNFVY